MLGAICNIWELNAPYGGHIVYTCLPYWELCVSHMGAMWKPYGLYGRCMAPYGTCWHHMKAIWEPSAPYKRRMAYGSHVVPDGSHMVPCGRWMGSYGKWGGHMRPMGTLPETSEPYRSLVHHTGAASTVWEPCMPHGSHMHCMGAPHALYESQMRDVNQMCTLRAKCEPCSPDDNHRCHMRGGWCPEAAGQSIWEPCGSHMAPC
jgi:hypothetical protein